MKEIKIGAWIWKKYKDTKMTVIRIPKSFPDLPKSNYLVKIYKLESEK